MSFKSKILGASALTAALYASAAFAAEGAAYKFNQPAQPLASALRAYSAAADQEIIFAGSLVDGRTAPALNGAYTADEALDMLLAGTGLAISRTPSGVLLLGAAQDPQGGSAAGGGADVDALIVTAQKREENIQDVPIAISAFTQEDLTNRQVAGGPDLVTQIPNFSFTKTNFTGYSIQIRGIGTQAISATTDPAVAVAFNNTPFVRNRFFEQEFYDVERVEVLRGPQGTLYGRNATAGVVNLLSAKPKFRYEAKASVDLGDYGSRRLEGMVNLPLVEDVAALRLAGAWTKRDGYVTNELTGDSIDGRDLWSVRASLRFEPTDWLRANFVYEHFAEDDDRLRSGKQLCKKDLGPETIGGLPVTGFGGVFGLLTYVSQGCERASFYSEEAFQTPNGFALPFYGPTGNIGNAVKQDVDPYRSAVQSRDLRVIESTLMPEYRAETNIAQFRLEADLGSSFTLASETAYSTDSLSSFQDYNRFTTTPQAFQRRSNNDPGLLDDDGVFCDPQLGCSDRLLLGDLSTAESRQFSQELRLSSDFDGPFNFSLGANYLRYDTEDKYYLFVNSLTMLATEWDNSNEPYVVGVTDNMGCLSDPYRESDPYGLYNIAGCTYIDPNPIGSLDDQGRNYFLSKNPYRLISYAAFGEAYYNITDTLKLTGGLRWTVDQKRAPQVPSWLLAASTSGPYTVAAIVDQEWSEPTGRLAIDWKPDLSFTDDTLLYASFAHGYKAGGANPPPPVVATYAASFSEETVLAMQTHPMTFEAEYVNAFEVGTKNTLLDGALTLNLGAFYYDYEGYQTSEIIDRSAVNSNYDAKVWGAELEAEWRPARNLTLGLRGGYQKTRIADGQYAIDLMDRTAGDPNFVLVRPFPTVPSNCILPAYVAAAGGRLNLQSSYYNVSANGVCIDAYYSGLDPVTGNPYQPGLNYGALLGPAFADYTGFDPLTAPNGGKGIDKDLGGNELPNAPNWSASLTADYTIPLPKDWLATLHTDVLWQSASWWRVFNDHEYNRLDEYFTMNFAAIFTNEERGWKVMAYVKNVFDNDAITGAFLNSDDTGLTTNVFLTEPRLYGLRVTKAWDGAPVLGDWLSGPGAEGPRALTLELGGGVTRADAPNHVYAPSFAGAYAPGVLPLEAQERDLDRGDDREVKLTYRPSDGWRVSASVRYGRANGTNNGLGVDPQPGGIVVGPPLVPEPKYRAHPGNYGYVSVVDREEFQVVDFMVGKDVGLGEKASSSVGLGLRYAELTSETDTHMAGMPNLYLPPTDILNYTANFNRHKVELDADRSFRGAGPAVSWDASLPLMGGEERGQVLLEGGVNGAVLFGKRKRSVSFEALEMEYEGKYLPETMGPTPLIDTDVVASGALSSSERATVPTLGLNLGLAYAVRGVKVSGGYRWERYFDAIDGGVEERSAQNRTIDGPYFKLAIGFGG